MYAEELFPVQTWQAPLEAHPQPDLVSRNMSSSQIAQVLAQHGIKDITDQLDYTRCSYEPFAHGGFASIHQGALLNGQLVAIKCIEILGYWGTWQPSGKHLKHAAHELYAWSKCNNPGILKAFGFALYGGAILLVSPWMENGSLARYLVRNSTCDRLRFCIELASSLEYLHDKGIVHGDIKAENVLVSDTGEAQLMDFGSATLVEYLTLYFTGTSRLPAFSLRFTAPEILDESSEKHTVEGDVYALGMTILQIATGEQPYAGKSDRAVVVNVFRTLLPPRPTFDGMLEEKCAKDMLWGLLLRCWEHDPRLRPTATEVKRDLLAIERKSSI